MRARASPGPEGKRYGRDHAAYLIFVCLSKQVIAIGDIQQLIPCSGARSLIGPWPTTISARSWKAFWPMCSTARRYGPIPAARMRGRPAWCVRRVCGGAQDLSVAIPALSARTGENAAVRRLTEESKGPVALCCASCRGSWGTSENLKWFRARWKMGFKKTCTCRDAARFFFALLSKPLIRSLYRTRSFHAVFMRGMS